MGHSCQNAHTEDVGAVWLPSQEPEGARGPFLHIGEGAVWGSDLRLALQELPEACEGVQRPSKRCESTCLVRSHALLSKCYLLGSHTGWSAQQEESSELNFTFFLGVKRVSCFMPGSLCQVLVLSRLATSSVDENKTFDAENLSTMFYISS